MFIITAKDFEIMKRIKNDIKTVYYIGNGILNLQRQLTIGKVKMNIVVVSNEEKN